jgi:3-hydroxy-5-methyl-1-naphthoate 3-O-methyltransferase
MSATLKSGPTAPLDPAPLMRLTTAYWDSQTFLTANRLRIFDRLAGKPRSARDFAADCGFAERATELFLNACVALGLLTQDADGRYHNASIADAFLVAGRPAYMGNAVSYGDQLYDTWAGLEGSLRSGRPALAADEYLGDDANRTRTFVRAMHDRATGIGRALVGLVDFTGRRNLLDVGGGPGTYSVLLTERFAGLNSEVLELPGVAAVARELVADAGAAARVRVIDGDYLVTPFRGGRDVVLMSGMFHRETPQTCRSLIARAFDCLVPGGLLVVSDVFADAGGTGPAFAALFGLNMMLTAPEGGVHADADVAQWMAEAGFSAVQRTPFPPPMPHRIVQGRRP